MTKKIYIPVAARRAAEVAYKNLMDHYNKAEYVPFYNGKHSRKQQKKFDTYFTANFFSNK